MSLLFTLIIILSIVLPLFPVPVLVTLAVVDIGIAIVVGGIGTRFQ